MINIHLKHLVRNLTLCLMISYSNSSFSAIYKWVDEQGNVHYSQQQPGNAAAEKMNIERHAPQDTSTYKRPSLNKDEPGGDETDSDTPAKAEEEKEKPKTAAEKKRLKAACAQARKQLATMQSIGRIRSKDEDGNTSYLSQQQKEARMKQIREQIKKLCK